LFLWYCWLYCSHIQHEVCDFAFILSRKKDSKTANAGICG
jgi:hypothetical protein